MDADPRAVIKINPLTILIVLVCLVLGRMAACVISAHPRPDAAQQRELQRVGDAIVASIEAWRSSHGTYPDSLEGAGIEAQRSTNGVWEYSVDADRNRFELRMGDYDRDGFVLFWNSTTRAWKMDT